MEDALHCITRFMHTHTDSSAGHIGIPTATKTYLPFSYTLRDIFLCRNQLWHQAKSSCPSIGKGKVILNLSRTDYFSYRYAETKLNE